MGNYIGFQGRAPRSEFWYWILFCALVGLSAGFVAGVIATLLNDDSVINITIAILTFTLLLPSVSAAIRRLHDVDKSGLWFLLTFIPVFGPMVLLVWFCIHGTPGRNRFGSDPLAGI